MNLIESPEELELELTLRSDGTQNGRLAVFDQLNVEDRIYINRIYMYPVGLAIIGSGYVWFNRITGELLPVPESFDEAFYTSTVNKTLHGSPKIINGDYIATDNQYISSLEGGPEIVKGKVNCSDCHNLVSLKGCPKIIHGDFNLLRTAVENLDYFPEEVHGIIYLPEQFKSKIKYVRRILKKMKYWDLIQIGYNNGFTNRRRFGAVSFQSK